MFCQLLNIWKVQIKSGVSQDAVKQRAEDVIFHKVPLLQYTALIIVE